MTDDQQVSASQEIIDLRDVTLRIPGECFFCDVIDLDAKVLDEKENESDLESELNFLRDKISEPGFSPYPEEQLSWGYHVCDLTKKAFIFATPTARLKQLGWQNLEVFRRVFLPLSIVSVKNMKRTIPCSCWQRKPSRWHILRRVLQC